MIAAAGITAPRIGWGLVAWTLAIQGAFFIVMALLGAVVAFVAGLRVAPFLAFLLAIVYLAAALGVDSAPMIPDSGATTRQIWWTWNVDYRLVQSLLLAAVVCVLVLTLDRFRAAGGTHTRADYYRVASVGIVLSLGFVLPDIPYKDDVAPTPAMTLCSTFAGVDGEELEFCGSPEDKRFLAHFEDMVVLGREFLNDAGRLLDEMPRRFETFGPDVLDRPNPEVTYVPLLSDVADSLVVPLIPSEIGVEEMEVVANNFVIPSACFTERNQERFDSNLEMRDVRNSLVFAVFDEFDSGDDDEFERLAPEIFAENYRKLMAWCAE